MDTTFEVHSGALAGITWTVLSIVGEEAVSELFKFVVQVRADHDELAAKAGVLEAIDRALCGQRVSFRLREGGTRRCGIVASARIEATADPGYARFAQLSLEIVPRAWLLTQRRNSRIFQGVYLPQIVSRVLVESGVSHRWNLESKLPRRAFCTQYDETDWEFLTRLFAEEGILFYFDHHPGVVKGAEPDMTDHEKDTLGDIARGLVGGGSVFSAASGVFGDEKAGGIVGAIGSGANVVGDLIKPIPKDEEDDAPKPLKPGHAGPAGWTDPDQSSDVLVFVDHAAYTAIPKDGRTLDDVEHKKKVHEVDLTLRDSSGMEVDEDTISELWPTGRVRTRKAALREFDFRRPMFVLESTKPVEEGVDAIPGMPANTAGLPDAYGHHSQYDKPYLPGDSAETRLGQLRADADTLAGRGGCSQMFAGGRFHLTNAKEAHLGDAHFAVVRVRHELHAPQQDSGHAGDDHRFSALARGCARAIHEALARREPVAEEAMNDIILREITRSSPPTPKRTYRNRFECVRKDLAFRPPPPPPLVRNVFESAIVVGPRGLPPPAPSPPDPNDPGSGDAAKEIYTDKYGRVKIQFHWDLEGTYDEHSSCWVRPSQAWAGAGFGFQFVPRVGMEVLVGFLRGDPDRPVILGSLYNATHATPEPLPQRNTRSGIRTQTSPGGGGFNELSFEDGRGVERVHIHAQKDFEETVNDTHTLNVKNNQRVTVSAEQLIQVGADRVVAVGGNQAAIVGGNESAQVKGSRTVHVEANESHAVRGDALRAIDGVAAENVKADKVTAVGGDLNLTVRGSAITQIGGKDPDTPASSITFVQGRSFLTASGGALVRVAGKDGSATLRLECGSSFIEIGPEKITFKAAAIEGLGDVKLASKTSSMTVDEDGTKMHGKSASMTTPDGAKVGADGKDVTMKGPGTIAAEGSEIKLNKTGGGGAGTKDGSGTSAQGPSLTLTFFHGGDGSFAIADTRYRVVAEDAVVEGKTAGDGKATFQVPANAKVAFVILWADQSYPKLYPGGPLQWLVHLVPELGAATSLKGARARLRNLGYEPGTKLDAGAVDPSTRAALLEFQIDREIPTTGQLEADTQKKLAESYGS